MKNEIINKTMQYLPQNMFILYTVTKSHIYLKNIGVHQTVTSYYIIKQQNKCKSCLILEYFFTDQYKNKNPQHLQIGV